MAFTHPSCPSSVCPSLYPYLKSQRGKRNAHISLVIPKDARISLVTSKDTPISLLIPKDARISLVIPKDAHISLVIPKDARISLVIPKDTHISKLETGATTSEGLRAFDDGDVSRLGLVRRPTLLQRDGRPTEGTHDGDWSREPDRRSEKGVAATAMRCVDGGDDGDGDRERRQRMERNGWRGGCVWSEGGRGRADERRMDVRQWRRENEEEEDEVGGGGDACGTPCLVDSIQTN
ncbi:hypothetical protein E6C27_scaffold102G00510 [Cucumis melo var. makuwa]|uniref:NBS-LRR type resistance protein n=1 Tax=Cucumis melo var. makuwa TaxID=1194695 RepID=A0A5A7UDX0_CUCMM|nr:hypothetical protein E6C27_scaffold102G00510 [Cucumis melo var. makuwa]